MGQAAHLTNAATAEFLLDQEHHPWFLEVNTRLQVEHGVTELAAGFDLVVEQFRIAAGEGLSASALAAADVAVNPSRHAIEVRLSAEDPARNFAAAPGRIGRFSMPTGDGLRVDTGVRPGDRVAPEYDPLVAKLLVVASERQAAIGRLRDALDRVEITGIQTTLPFHRFVARDPSFAAGDVSIDWVAEHWEGPAQRAAARPAANRAAAQAAATAPPMVSEPGPASPWRRAAREAWFEEWPE